MKRIGFDLDAVSAGTSERPSHGDCPGALLLVTRDEYDTMVRGGEFFTTPRSEMDPEGGRRDARVACNGVVMRWERHGRMYYAGLCASCTEAEKRMREAARERLAARGQR